jgi:hypothetical protein
VWAVGGTSCRDTGKQEMSTKLRFTKNEDQIDSWVALNRLLYQLKLTRKYAFKRHHSVSNIPSIDFINITDEMHEKIEELAIRVVSKRPNH